MTRRVKPNPRGTFSEKMAWVRLNHMEEVLEGIVADTPGGDQLTADDLAEIRTAVCLRLLEDAQL